MAPSGATRSRSMRDVTRVTHGVTPAGPTAGFASATPTATGAAAIIERLATKGSAWRSPPAAACSSRHPVGTSETTCWPS